MPSACLCCDSQLLVRDPALCRTHQPKISSHSSTRSFPASLLSSTNHQRRFRLKFILGSSCLFCIPATKLLVLGLYQQTLQQCPTPRHTSKSSILGPDASHVQEDPHASHVQEGPDESKPRYKKAQLQVTLQDDPQARRNYLMNHSLSCFCFIFTPKAFINSFA